MNKQFEAVLEGQKKAMEFWADMSEQMTGAFTQGSKKESDAKNLLTEWYEKQQQFFTEMMKVSNPGDALQNAPDQFRKWMELQNKFAEKWMEFYQENAGKLGIKLPGSNGEFTPQKYFEEGMKQWKNWMENANPFMKDQLLSKLPYNMQPHFTNFVETYNNMFHNWEPIRQMIQNGIFEQKVIEKYYSPDAYHKMINQIMGFKPVGNVSELIENVNSWIEKYLNFTSKEWTDWNTISDNWKQGMKGYLEKGNFPVFEMATEFNNRLRDQLVPFQNVMGQGRQAEAVKILRDIQFAYVSFILKSSELQTKLYESGQFVLPDTIRAFYAEYKDKKDLPDFQTFFNRYINDLEETLLQVLHSEEYSRLQSETSATGTQIQSNMDKFLEQTLVYLPFLTKTDGDDIAKETNALRKKVRTLEQRITELEKSLLLAGKPAVAKEKEVSADPKKKLFDRIGKASAKDRDDLKTIKGIGPKLEKMLNELGVYTFRQLSKMTEEEYHLIDELLDAFQGRAQRDAWAEQAKGLLHSEV